MLTAHQVLDLEYLNARCMLIEVAAVLDRYDRAAADAEGLPSAGQSNGRANDDDRLEQLYDALTLLARRGEAGPNRSEQLLDLFSDPD